MYTHLTYFADSSCKSLFITAMVAIYTQVFYMFVSSTKYWQRWCFVGALVLGVVSLGVAGFLFYLTLISDIATPVIFQFYCLGLLVWRYIFLHIPCALLLHRLLHPDPAILTLHLFPHEGLLGRH